MTTMKLMLGCCSGKAQPNEVRAMTLVDVGTAMRVILECGTAVSDCSWIDLSPEKAPNPNPNWIDLSPEKASPARPVESMIHSKPCTEISNIVSFVDESLFKGSDYKTRPLEPCSPLLGREGYLLTDRH